MIYRKAGYLTLGSRLKRLGERVLNEVRTVYRQAELPFETSWFPVFYVLREEGMCSVQELSSMLEVSHSAISQLVSQLERKGLIEVRVSPEDLRRKEIILTADGEKLMERILPVWRAFESSFREHLDARMPEILDSLEASLDSGIISATALELLEAAGSKPDIRYLTHVSEDAQAFIGAHDLNCVDGNEYLILYAGGLPAGLLCFARRKEGILIGEIFIVPAFRGRGYGRQLLDELDIAAGKHPLILQRTSPEVLQLLHRTGHSFIVDLNHQA